jgi:hypothetical protein
VLVGAAAHSIKMAEMAAVAVEVCAQLQIFQFLKE